MMPAAVSRGFGVTPAFSVYTLSEADIPPTRHRI